MEIKRITTQITLDGLLIKKIVIMKILNALVKDNLCLAKIFQVNTEEK